MTSPASPYIAPDASDKKWWDPLGLFASKPAPSNPPSDFTPSATAGRRRKFSKKAGRRTRRAKKGGDDGPKPTQFTDEDIGKITQGPKYDFPPVPPRKGKGGRRTRRGKKHSRK